MDAVASGAGIKVLTFVKRPPGTDVQGFQEAWRKEGTEIAASDPDVVCYIQSHTLLNGYRGREPIFDGVSELWIDRDRASEVDSIEMARANAVDPTLNVALVVEDHVIKGAANLPAEARKCFALTYQRADLPDAAFHEHWLKRHGPIAARIPGMLKYIQCHARRPLKMPDGRLLAGCAITWWAKTSDLRDSMNTSEYEETLRDEPNFIDGASPVILTKEELVLRMGQEGEAPRGPTGRTG